MVVDKSLETESNCTLKASEMNSNLIISKYMISLNSQDWSLWGQAPVSWMLRTEKEVLRGRERTSSFCSPPRPCEKEEKGRKDEGDRYKKQTFSMLNKGDSVVFATSLNFALSFFCIFLSFLHTTLHSIIEIIPLKRSVMACTYACVLHCTLYHSSEVSICIVFNTIVILQQHLHR